MGRLLDYLIIYTYIYIYIVCLKLFKYLLASLKILLKFFFRHYKYYMCPLDIQISKFKNNKVLEIIKFYIYLYFIKYELSLVN